MSNQEISEIDWRGLLKPYAEPVGLFAWVQLITTSFLYVVNWALMYWALSYSYVLVLILAVPGAGLLTRLFIFQHDCGHRSFFESKALNEKVGRLLGILTLTPFEYWRRTHDIHHATTGNLDKQSFGEFKIWTVGEYTKASRWGRLKYRLYRNIFAILIVGSVWTFVFKHRYPGKLPKNWRKERGSVWRTNIGIGLVMLLAWSTVGLKNFLLVQAPITLFGGVFGIWLFYVQHQFEKTYWRREEEWNFYEACLKGSSFLDLPRVLRWFTGNIGFHHVHHLDVRIPNYNLEECYRKNPELQSAYRMTLADSFRSARLSLWNERKKCLVGFRSVGCLRRIE